MFIEFCLKASKRNAKDSNCKARGNFLESTCYDILPLEEAYQKKFLVFSLTRSFQIVVESTYDSISSSFDSHFDISSFTINLDAVLGEKFVAMSYKILGLLQDRVNKLQNFGDLIDS